MHDYMWPTTAWHYWTERRFKKFCEHWGFITYAAGASASKSYDAAKIGLLFWLTNPKERAVIVASTSLESLSTRIWGYVIKHLNKSALYHPVVQMGGQSPKVLYDYKLEGKKTKDQIHGMFAIAAKQGDDEKVISSWIGRHPDDAIMVILDEATDMPPALVKALPNLEQGVNYFHCMAIGNSNSKFDLHGALSTPLEGWESIDPFKDNMWLTNQKNGLCLYFSCYESPAIFETDLVKKEVLSKFLITQEQIEDKEKLYGKDSDSFWRFVMGFWRTDSVDEAVVSSKFITDFDVFKKTEWSGIYPLSIVAGLDPAFSAGGDRCILRLAIIGVDTSGQVVLDFKGQELLFNISILRTDRDSIDIQIAKQVINIMRQYGVKMGDLCIDANGQGRALGEVIKLQANELTPPLKIYSVKGNGVGSPTNNFDIIIKNSHELWFAFRNFIQNRQIRGIDYTTASQLTTRLIIKERGRQMLEPKKQYRTRMGAISPALAHSPDEADAAALCLQAAIINYGFTPGQKRSVSINNNFVNDKFWTFKQLQREQLGIEVGEVTRPAPPLATFGSDVTSTLDYKDRLSNF